MRCVTVMKMHVTVDALMSRTRHPLTCASQLQFGNDSTFRLYQTNISTTLQSLFISLLPPSSRIPSQLASHTRANSDIASHRTRARKTGWVVAWVVAAWRNEFPHIPSRSCRLVRSSRITGARAASTVCRMSPESPRAREQDQMRPRRSQEV